LKAILKLARRIRNKAGVLPDREQDIKTTQRFTHKGKKGSKGRKERVGGGGRRKKKKKKKKRNRK